MSSSYLNFYEMSHIPCGQTSPENRTKSELGLSHPNVDGKFVHGGFQVNNACHYGGVTIHNMGYVNSGTSTHPGNYTLWYADNVLYTVGGQGVASTANAIKLSKMQFPL